MALSTVIPAAALAANPPVGEIPVSYLPMGEAPAGKLPKQGWSGKGQLGFLNSQGNSPARSANATIDLAYVAGAWEHSLHGDMLYGKSGGVVSAERWDLLWQSSDHITPKFYPFGALRYERDLFDGFQYQANVAAGVGYNVVKTKATSFSIQVGAGYMLSRPEQVTPQPTGAVFRYLQPRQNYAIGTAGLDYDHKISATTSVSDKFLVNSGGFNTLIVNALALTVKMSTKLAVSLGYNVQDNTHPPQGIKNIDTTETVNLVYAF